MFLRYFYRSVGIKEASLLVVSAVAMLLLFLLLPCLSFSQPLAGYHFQDNLLEQRFGPENGYTTFNTGRPIPDQVSRVGLDAETPPLHRTARCLQCQGKSNNSCAFFSDLFEA